MPDRKPANPRLLLVMVIAFMLGISVVAIVIVTR